MKLTATTSSSGGSGRGSRTVTRTPPPHATSDAAAGEGSIKSYYFPGCQKDANCHCEMCQASINATLDLLPSTTAKSSITRDTVATRRRTSSLKHFSASPPALPTLKSMKIPEKKTNKKRSKLDTTTVSRVCLLVCFLWMFDCAVPVLVSRWYEPTMSAQGVDKIVEESGFDNGDYRGRIRVLEEKIGEIVGKERVFNCSSLDSNWELQQGTQHFFHWKCVIYKSIAEEISIWGSPIQTSGFITVTCAPRTLTVLSGRITEWSEGMLTSKLRYSNSSSWALRKWSAVALQLEPETWILEHHHSAILEGSGIFEAIYDMAKLKASVLLGSLSYHMLPGTYRDSLEALVNPT